MNATMKKIFFFTIGLFTASLIFGQASNRDSSRAQGMRNMQILLKLTDVQVKEITELTIAEEQKLAKLKNVSITPEARKQQMENNYDAYRKSIRKILTKEQWDQYVAFQNEKRKQLVEEGKKKKIKVELGKIKD